MSGTHKHQDFIDELLPLAGGPQFDAMFKQLSAELPRAEAFQLKMEIKALAKPCTKTVDLRGKVDGDCKLVELGGRNHYLDEVAQDVLSEQLLKYNGIYTEAVYNALLNTSNNFRVMRLKEEEENKSSQLESLGVFNTAKAPVKKSTAPIVKNDKNYLARLKTFKEYYVRKQERMLYVTKLFVTSDTSTIGAISLDLSVDGLKVKIAGTKNTFKKGQELSINFTQISKEMTFKNSENIRYQVIYSKQRERETVIGLSILQIEENKELRVLAHNLIKGNKLRYNVDTSNVEDAILVRGYESQSVTTLPSLPIFYSRFAMQLQLVFGQTNNCSKKIQDYFNYSGYSALNQILTEERLAPFFEQAGPIKRCLLLTFKLKQTANKNMVAVFNFELPKKLREEFLAFANSQEDFRQFVVTSTNIKSSEHNIKSVLPSSLSAEVKKKNKPISSRVVKKLTPLTGIFQLLDVTAEVFKREGDANIGLSKFKPFVIAKISPGPLEFMARDFVDNRKESRFKLNSAIEAFINADKIAASIVEFSIQGLRIAVESPIPAKIGDELVLNLIQLQEMTKIFKLHRLPYKIINFSNSKKHIHLHSVPNEQGKHVGRLFFRELIKSSKGKLVNDDLGEREETSNGLTNLLITYQNQSVAFLEMTEKSLGIKTLITNNQSHPIIQNCKIVENELGKCIDLSNVISNKYIGKLQDKVKRKLEKNYLDIILVYGDKNNLALRTDEDFADLKLLTDYIKKAQELEYVVLVIRVYIMAPMRYAPNYFNLELRYVNQYAPHKADTLRKQLTTIRGVCQMFDVTDLYKTLIT